MTQNNGIPDATKQTRIKQVAEMTSTRNHRLAVESSRHLDSQGVLIVQTLLYRLIYSC